MKVMYFTIEGFDTPNANNHLALTMIETFLDNGIDVYLLQSNRKGLQDDVPKSLKNNDRFSYDNISRKQVKKTNFIARYLEGIKYAFDARKIWKKSAKDVDAIIVQSTYLSWLSIKMLKKIKKPIIFSIFDLFPNVVFDVGASNSKIIYKCLLKLQNIAYKNSDKIVVITDDVKNKLISQGIDEKKLVKIVNWFDENKIKEVSINDNKFIKKYNIDKGKFYVQYAGNFGFTFNYKYVIEVAKELREYQNIEFQMIGSGTFETEFKACAKELGNIKFYPWQPLDIISDVYSSCSIGFIPLSKGVIGNSFPSKLSLIMACNRTFVVCADMNTFFAKEVNDNKIGICVSDTDPKDAARAILKLYEDSKIRFELAARAKKYSMVEYNSKNNAIKFVELFKEIAQ